MGQQVSKKLAKNGPIFFLVLSESCAVGKKGLKAGWHKFFVGLGAWLLKQFGLASRDLKCVRQTMLFSIFSRQNVYIASFCILWGQHHLHYLIIPETKTKLGPTLQTVSTDSPFGIFTNQTLSVLCGKLFITTILQKWESTWPRPSTETCFFFHVIFYAKTGNFSSN